MQEIINLLQSDQKRENRKAMWLNAELVPIWVLQVEAWGWSDHPGL